MQYRYKLAGSNQRKSTTQQSHNINSYKNDTLIFINLLDKCTQILREDRIWIRNQLKSGDQELFRIFKQAKRPLNLQHLQIRLRKHVTGVKSKAKMEQLLRFKQNMNLGHLQYKEDHHVDKAIQNKESKYQLVEANKNSSVDPRGFREKTNYSLEKLKTNMQYRGTSVNTKKSQESYQVPMEQITQRESENMTSARHKVFADDHQSYPFSNVYNKWKRPEHSTSALNGASYMNEPLKNRFNQTSTINNFFANEIVKQKSKLLPFSEINANPMHKRQERAQQHPQIHFDQASFEQNNFQENQSCANSHGLSYQKSQSPNPVKQTIEPQRSHSYSRSNHYHSNFLDNQDHSGKKYEQKSKTMEEIERQSVSGKKYEIQSYKSDLIDETNLMQSKNNTIYESSSANQSLFTSPELLAECRNFLKLKSGSKQPIQREYTNRNCTMEFNSNFEPLKFEHNQPDKKNDKQFYDFKSSMTQIFHEIKTDMASSISQPQEFQNDQKPIYSTEISKITREVTNNVSSLSRQSLTRQSLPRQLLTREPFPRQTLQKQATREYIIKQTHHDQPSDFVNSGSFEYLHTFAGLSSQKKVQPSFTSPEEFLDKVFQAVSREPQGYIDWNTLQSLVLKKCPRYQDSFRQYLCPSEDEQFVLISNIGRLLQDLMTSQNVQPAENDSRTICRLLDIEQKGYINEQDIEDFIRQLEESETEDIQVISQCLWRLFESIDRDAEENDGKRVDYWGIYSKKNSSDFEELNEILKQFQFQIE